MTATNIKSALWGIFDTENREVVERFKTREAARRFRRSAFQSQMKRYRLAHLKLNERVEIISR
jgi:hypothetical protein